MENQGEQYRKWTTEDVGKVKGLHPDGSFTLCPEVVKVLKRLMLQRGRRGIVLPDYDSMTTLAEAIREHQSIEFEQYT